ncbi:MAG: hypothetical protein VYA55_17110 [Pseudomonadota bacterium]|nr:hypothetical protein [Pseudomonadota bacterium]
MAPDQARGWQEVLALTYEQMLQQLIVFAPKLLGAFLLLVIGGLVAFLISRATRTGMHFFERLLMRLFPSLFVKPDLKFRPININAVSKMIFWLVFLLFVAAAANSLGLEMVSRWMSDLLLYLPRLAVGLLIMIGGYLISNIVELMVVSAVESAGSKQAKWIGKVTQFAVFFTAIVIGIEQFGINIHFFTQFFIVMSAILLGGFSLSFALGARTLVANIIGAQQAAKFLQLGDEVSIAGIDGVVVEISGTMLVIESHQGRVTVPANLFMENVGCIKSSSGSGK